MPSKVSQIIKKRNWAQTETILHIVSKLQVNHTCLQGGDGSANFCWKVD